MARGFDWSRARPRKPTLSIVDENAPPPPPRRRFVPRRGPKLTKEQMRAAADAAVREHVAKKAAEAEAKGIDLSTTEVPW